MSKKDTNLICVLDRFENSKAVLKFTFSQTDSQELILAKRYLPDNAKEGDVLYLDLYSDKKAEERRRNLAKQMLEEILKGNK